MTQIDDVIFVEVKKNTEKEPIPGSYDSLYEELKQRCNPENFIEPYDKKKIDVANEIYQQLLESSQDDSQLKELRHRALKDLEVKFSTEKLYHYLAGICYPKNFTGEYYDAQNLRLANELHPKIKENADDIEVLEDCELKAKDLICIIEERRKKETARKVEEIARQKEKVQIINQYDDFNGKINVAVWFLFISFAIFVLTLFEDTVYVLFPLFGILLFSYMLYDMYKKKRKFKEQHKDILST